MELRHPRDGSLLPEESIFELSYSLGTYYARFLRQLTEQVAIASGKPKSDSREARMEVARALIKALPKLSVEVKKATEAGYYLSPYFILKPLYETLGKTEGRFCKSSRMFR